MLTLDGKRYCDCCGEQIERDDRRHTCPNAWKTLGRESGVLVNGMLVVGDGTAIERDDITGRRIYAWYAGNETFASKREAYRYAKGRE